MSVGRRFLFSVFSILLWFNALISKSESEEFCNNTQSTNGCCNNFNKVNGTCNKCPNGTFGQNCSSKCLPNMFGEFCLQKCNCENNEECNSIRGCIIPGAYCSNLESSDVRCCSNYVLSDGVCKECAPGTYSTNCSDECPEGYYGMLCAEKCTCQGHCDKVIGCSVFVTTKQWVYWCFLTVPGIALFVCIGFAYLRWKRKHSKSKNFAVFDVNTSNYNVDEVEGDTDNLMIGSFEGVFDNEGYQILTLSRYKYEEPVRSTTLTKPFLETLSLDVKHQTELAGEEIQISSRNSSSSLGIKKSKNDYTSGSVGESVLLSCVNTQEELPISNAEQPFEVCTNENNSKENLEDNKLTGLVEETFNCNVNEVTAGGDSDNLMLGPFDEIPNNEGYQTMTVSRYNYEEPMRSKLLTKYSLETSSLTVTQPPK